MPRKSPPKPKVIAIPKSAALPPQLPPVVEPQRLQETCDYPKVELPVIKSNGDRGDLSFSSQYVPWFDTLDRTELKQALIEVDTDKAQRFIELLADPRLMDFPVSSVAEQAGIRVPELMMIWRNHKKIAAMGVALAHAPEIAADTVADARTVQVVCNRCDGAGEIRIVKSTGPEWRQCVNCQGTGAITRVGDLKSREWVLRAAGVIAAEQPTVSLNLNVGASSVLDELEALERSSPAIVDIPPSDA